MKNKIAVSKKHKGATQNMNTLERVAPLCEICNERPREQVHHKDKNHKNNKPKNLQHICTLCHVKIHGMEPRYSELRYLVTLYTKCQKARIAIENQIRGFSRIELETPDFFLELINSLEEEEKLYSKKIRTFLENKKNVGINESDSEYVQSSYNYLKQIRGISHILAGKLIALVDLNNSPTVSCLWSYAGQTPNSKKTKGKKSNWNQDLKKVCYQISDSFVKQRTPKYREIYDKEKAKQLELLNLKEDEETMRSLKNQIGDISLPTSKLHVEMRARRKAVKEFLKDYWINCRSEK